MPKLPGINHLDAIRALEKLGFHVARQGKHTILTDGNRILTIPRHNPIHAITMGNIVRDAGLSNDEFRKLLQHFTAELGKVGRTIRPLNSKCRTGLSGLRSQRPLECSVTA